MISNVSNNSPNFGGSLVGYTHVLKKNIFGKYRSKEVAVIEFKPDDNRDFKAFKKLNNLWKAEFEKLKPEGKHYYVDSIFDRIQAKATNDLFPKTRFFGLTTQRHFFNHINPKKVLGVAQLKTEIYIPEWTDLQITRPKLDAIQTRPKYEYGKDKSRNIKHIGKMLLKSLRKMTEKPIYLFSDDNAKGFYRAYGAYPDEKNWDHFYID